MKWKRRLKRAAIGLALFVLAWVFLAPRIGAWKMAYPPHFYGGKAKQGRLWKEACALPDVKATQAKVPGASPEVLLNTWLLAPASLPTASSPTCVLMLHGIAADKTLMYGFAPPLLKQGLAACLIDSRAHGLTEGGKCTFGAWEHRDVGAVLHWLRMQHGYTRFVLLGHSMGAATVLQSLDQDEGLAAVIALAPFADMREIAVHYGKKFTLVGIPWTVSATLRRYEALADFKTADVSPERNARDARNHPPLLLLHGSADTNISSSNSERIAAAYPGKARVRIIDGATHYSIVEPKYRDAVMEEVGTFLQDEKLSVWTAN